MQLLFLAKLNSQLRPCSARYHPFEQEGFPGLTARSALEAFWSSLRPACLILLPLPSVKKKSLMKQACSTARIRRKVDEERDMRISSWESRYERSERRSSRSSMCISSSSILRVQTYVCVFKGAGSSAADMLLFGCSNSAPLESVCMCCVFPSFTSLGFR